MNIENSAEQRIFTLPPDGEGGRGYLTVRVSTARGAIPLPDARVTLRGSQKADSGVVSVAVTGRDGMTPRFSLPVPPRENSESPGIENPFYTYNIEVEREGYGTQYYYGVPVFEGISALQTVELVPLAENGTPDGFGRDGDRFYEIETPESRAL